MEVNNNNNKIPYGLNNISLFDGTELKSPLSYSDSESREPIKISPIQGVKQCNHEWIGPIIEANMFDGDTQGYYACPKCKLKVPAYEISTTKGTGNAYIKKRWY